MVISRSSSYWSRKNAAPSANTAFVASADSCRIPLSARFTDFHIEHENSKRKDYQLNWRRSAVIARVAARYCSRSCCVQSSTFCRLSEAVESTVRLTTASSLLVFHHGEIGRKLTITTHRCRPRVVMYAPRPLPPSPTHYVLQITRLSLVHHRLAGSQPLQLGL